MTVRRRDGDEEPYKAWIRQHKGLDSRAHGLSITDIDECIHRYLTCTDTQGTREIQHLMFLEVKTFGAEVPAAQRDSLNVIDRVLRQSDKKTIRLSGDRVPKRYIRSWGVHYLRMSGDTPNNSEWIRWDEKLITMGALVELLRFERDPDTLQPRSDRRHHAPSLAKQLQPRLRGKVL